MKLLKSVAALAAMGLSLPAAALEAENVLTGIPDGFVVGFQQSDGVSTLIEYIPEDESLEDWSTMVTIAIRRDLADADASVVAENLAAAWDEACPGSASEALGEDEVNGYPLVVWLYQCPLNAQTGKPETMMMEVIPGRDALYMVQYAVRAEWSDDFMTEAVDYLSESVLVCDTRIPEQACPEGME